ncbi:MAG TPA: permease [Flavobacteriaceae bacterium]|nr:permease [Flavobacteriaceae bacterium]|tara:strand:+ start:51890 stop:53209 length:1320 start_codon:yes stop_codon:yes gene_type:complete
MNSDLILLLVLLIWIILGTSVLRWPPLRVLFLGTFFGAIVFQVPLLDWPSVIGMGFISTVKKIGVLIFLGSWIGVCLEASGATLSIAKTLLRKMAKWPLHFVVGFIGYWVSIPVFCDAAFVILNSLNNQLAQESQTPKMGLTVALSTGLFATHVLVPPTPGPLAAAANFELTQLFILFLWGGLLAFVLTLAGAGYSYWIGRNVKETIPIESPTGISPKTSKLPPTGKAISPIMVPIFMMALGTLPTQNSTLRYLLSVLSNPLIALFIGGVMGIPLLQRYTDTPLKHQARKSWDQALPIVMITAMGGALGKVLQQLPLGEYLTVLSFPERMGLLIPFLLAAFLKTAQGSSTVAILTASAITFPLLPGLGLDSDMGKIWGILAIGTGAMTVSHANDSYFWIVSQVGGIEPQKALRTHTVATFFQGLLGILILLLSFQFIGK